MNISSYIKETGLSIYNLSRKSDIPYTTLSSICNGNVNILDCRVGTLIKLSDALGVELLDVVNSTLVKPLKYNFIDSKILINKNNLPKSMIKTINELEEYDRNNDPMFYECADMLYMMADRFLKDGSIDSKTYRDLISKYPIA